MNDIAEMLANAKAKGYEQGKADALKESKGQYPWNTYYQQGRTDAEKEDFVKACIKRLKESGADEIKVSGDTKDGYEVTVIVKLKER